MLERTDYEPEPRNIIVGGCCICNTTIYADDDRYFIKDDLVCTDCIDEYIDQYLIYGVD